MKVLRAFEGGEVRRVGSRTTTEARFQLLVAVQEEPSSLRDSGRWREDFYYRVAGIVIRVPALVDHASDIRLIAAAFLAARGLPPLIGEATALL